MWQLTLCALVSTVGVFDLTLEGNIISFDSLLQFDLSSQVSYSLPAVNVVVVF